MATAPPEDRQDAASRQRRLGDAAKLLPVLAAVLMGIPALWAIGASTSVALIYVFSVWGVMIVVIGVLSRALSRHVGRSDDRTSARRTDG